jgi:RNA polymerase sigma-54 factor
MFDARARWVLQQEQTGMNSGPRQSLSSQQKQVMSMRTLASLRLLQLSSTELRAEIAQAIATNPFLEEADGTSEEDDSTLISAGGPAPGMADSPPLGAAAETGAIQDYIEWGSGTSGDSEITHSVFDQIANAAVAPTLFEALEGSLFNLGLSERERCLAGLVARGIDDDGYLRQDLRELSELIDPSYGVTYEEMEGALKNVQEADVPGIGARSLRECLRLQLRALSPATLGRELAERIVESHLDLLGQRKLAQLAALLECTADQLNAARALIAELNPKPGLVYGAAEPTYVIPDVTVYREGRRWLVRENPAALPRARLNVLYARLHASVCAAKSSSAMAEQLRDARWKLRDIENRNSTILLVAQCLVGMQQAFFHYGDVALRPVSLRDIAAELGLNASTISRATSNKFMQTPLGTISFKRLFSRELATTTGGQCSTASAKAAVEALLASEDSGGALTDRAITEALACNGIAIARRTVTKYRNQLGKSPFGVRRKQG